DDAGNQRVGMDNRLGDQILSHSHQQGHPHHSIECFEDIPFAQYEPGHHHHEAVPHKKGHENRQPESVLQKQPHTAEAAHDDLVGHDETGETDGEKHQSHRDYQVILPVERFEITNLFGHEEIY